MDIKYSFEAQGWIKFGEEDSFKNGCLPETSFLYSGTDTFTGNTLESLIEECQRFCGSSNQNDLVLDSCGEIGRLDISVLVNEAGITASIGEIKLWKKGKIKLYSCVYTFHVQSVGRKDVPLYQSISNKLKLKA